MERNLGGGALRPMGAVDLQRLPAAKHLDGSTQSMATKIAKETEAGRWPTGPALSHVARGSALECTASLMQDECESEHGSDYDYAHEHEAVMSAADAWPLI